MLQYGSVIWPQSEKYAPGARQHLLPKPTNIIQLASRDRIPLLVNTWQQPPQRYVCARLFYENDGLLHHIFVRVCLKSSFFCWLADTFCHWLKVTVPLAVTVRYYIIRIWYGDCIYCDTPVCVVTLVYVCLNMCVCVSLPTVLVLTLLVFRVALGCHRSLGTQWRAGKTHVKIYSHWAWLQPSQLAAIWQMTFNRSYCSFCILMSI